MNSQLLLIITIIFLIYVYVAYDQAMLSKRHFIELRLFYYAYWYYLLWSDAPKYIIIILTFGYLILTSIQSPKTSVSEESDKVNTYILGYRRGFARGIEHAKN